MQSEAIEARSREEEALVAKVRALRDVISESRDSMASPQMRLLMLSRRKSAQALEGLSEAHMHEFKSSFKLIRVPSSSASTVICAICTLLALEEHGPSAAKKRQEVLPWAAARNQLARSDLLRALVNFDALRLVGEPELATKLRHAIRKDDAPRTLGSAASAADVLSTKSRWKAAAKSVGSFKTAADAKGELPVVTHKEATLSASDKREVHGMIVTLEPTRADIDFIMKECDHNADGKHPRL